MSNGLQNVEWLLGGEPRDTSCDRGESFIEALSFFIGKFETTELNENDMNDLEAMGIYEEVSQIEALFHKIEDKLFSEESLNESPEILLSALPTAIATAMGALAFGSAMFHNWVKEGTILPKGVTMAISAIRKWVVSAPTPSAKSARRERLTNMIKNKNAEWSPMQVKAAVDRILTNEDRNAAIGTSSEKPQGSGRHGTYETGFAHTKKVENMSPKEREAYNRKRFPNIKR